MRLRRSLASTYVWRTVIRAAAVAAAVYGAFVFVIAPLTGHFAGEFEDFGAYLGAAQASAAHADIYAAFTHQAQNVALSGFDYPPVVALLVTPLAYVPVNVAATLWLLVGVAATFAGAVIVTRTLLPATWPRLELAVFMTVLYAPATYNLWHGQMNPVVFLLLALALRSWVRGEQTRCGALIGVAAAIKLAPVVLLLLFLRRRWWKGTAAAGAVLAVSFGGGVLVYGLHTTVEYLQSVLPVLSRDDGWLYNQSWAGAVNRLADHSVLAFQPGLLVTRVVALALSVASLAAAAWTVRPGRIGSETRGAQFGAGVIAMLLAGTITWYAHDIHLLIPLAAGAALVARRREYRRPLVISLVLVALATAVLAPLLISVASMPSIVAVSQTGWWWPLLQLTSAPTFAAATLLAALVVALRARAGQPAGSAAYHRRAQGVST
jgi:alpha-1,2-mannosyltransferase